MLESIRPVALHIRDGYDAGIHFLQAKVFKGIVLYATHPLVILATMLLLIPLLLDASNTALALVLGNYTNVVSATVASIVLMTSMAHHASNQRQHASHREALRQHGKELAELTEMVKHLIEDRHQESSLPRALPSATYAERPTAMMPTVATASRRRSSSSTRAIKSNEQPT